VGRTSIKLFPWRRAGWVFTRQPQTDREGSIELIGRLLKLPAGSPSRIPNKTVGVRFEVRRGKFILPHGGIKPPLHQTVPAPTNGTD